MDSFMFQTVGVEIADKISQCLGVPLVKRPISGQSVNQGMYYEEEKGQKDEVEDLYQLIKQVKEAYPEV